MKHSYLKHALLCLCLFISTKAFAYDVEIDGIYYNFSGDEATVTFGSPEYSGSVVISESVTYNDKTYRVTSIGEWAFSSCKSLTSLTIPNSVTSIGRASFYGCSNLTSVTIGNGVTIIDEWAFAYCSNLTSVIIPNGVKSIGIATFIDCFNLTSITIPNSVTDIGGSAFQGCASLTSITIPNSVATIGETAFYECSSLMSVHITDLSAWYNIKFGNYLSNPLWYAHHLYLNDEEIKEIVVPNNVSSINDYAFCGYDGLTSVTIGNGVASINSYAFSHCSSLTSISIPHSVTSIGAYAFCECYSLHSITIPNSVTSISEYTFYNCSSLTSVTISEGVTSIGNNAFNKCTNLVEVKLPNTLTSIGYSAFDDCYALAAIDIPSGVSFIDGAAFSDCRSLTSLILPEGIPSIGECFCDGCTSLTSINIPNSVTSIGRNAFWNCTSLTSATIGRDVTSIGQWAFNGCSSLTSFKVDRDTPLTISSDVFSNQSNAMLIVPDGCRSAYESAEYWEDFETIVEESDVNNITIGSTGFATLCSSNAMDLTYAVGAKAYIASSFDPYTYTLTLTRVTEVPAGEGLYIVGAPSSYGAPTIDTDQTYSNLLKGVTTATTIYPTDGSYTNFILANGKHGVAFYSLSEAGELAAGKAYLQLPTASVSEVKAISVIFDDDEDAMLNIEEESQTQRIYNLQGQQVNTPKSGLYIINGKKVFIK